jgi:hypothetical protein
MATLVATLAVCCSTAAAEELRSGSAGEVVRLPRVMPASEATDEAYEGDTSRAKPREAPPIEYEPADPAGYFASDPELNPQVGQPPPRPLPPIASPKSTTGQRNPDMPPDARPGMFQKLIFDYTWISPGSRTRGFGDNQLELKTILAFPIPSRDAPLVITPGFGAHFFEGPLSPDLPPRVYDAYAQFRWRKRLNPRWAIDLAVTPGVYSDFRQGSDDALRISGHGGAMWTLTPDFKLVGGVAYLDRTDLPLLPFGGILWTPRDDLKIELMMPRPRIARRVSWCGGEPPEVEDWIYVAGEYGGGDWAVLRDSGITDQVSYRDFRVILGMERKDLGGLDYSLEVGYLFGRRIEFKSATPAFEPEDSVMVRGSLVY